MMRTNSHGSVVSVDEVKLATEDLPQSPPPVISEEPQAEAAGEEKTADFRRDRPPAASLTPPEIFPRLPGDEVKEIDMDATPKPKDTEQSDTDPDPTPRPPASRAQSHAMASPSPERRQQGPSTL